jgi:Beta-propeller repeat/Abnormal spindle-like microcephaly-assoc'd, ASPM-SPD-2-Hydin
MQAEQTRRRIRLAGGRIVIPVLLALSYTFFLPIVHARQGSETGVGTSAARASKHGNLSGPPAKLPGARLAQAYGRLPLSFEANRGQAPNQVHFLARGQGFTLFLAGDEAALALRKAGVGNQGPAVTSPRTASPESLTPNPVLRMKVLGADPAAAAAGVDLLPGQANYFIGDDPTKWRTHIPTYRQVSYRNIYPGVDLVYYGNAGQLEYDFRVNPGASPEAIRVALDGVAQSRLNAKGDLALMVPGGEVLLEKPLAYQVDAAGERQLVDADFVLQGRQSENANQQSTIDNNRQSTIGFRLGSYDRSRVLVIDPTLTYSTYLGGAGADSALGVAVRTDPSSGDTYAYVTGQTSSTDFPVSSGVFQSSFGTKSPTLTCANGAPATNAFVSELEPDGSGLVYSTYLGGEGCDAAAAITVDPSGNAYVTGNTNSSHYPITPDAVQAIPGGGVDTLVTEIAPGGASLVFSTFFGGKGDDYGTGINIVPPSQTNSTVYVCVAGSTASQASGKTVIDNFPVTPRALQATFGGGATDAFFFQLTATQTGSTATSWAVAYSTYLGGSGADSASAIALDGSGDIYVAGVTESSNFPLISSSSSTPFQKALNGTSDAFVSEFSAPVDVSQCFGISPCKQSNLLVSSYLGGSGADSGNGIAVDGSGNLYVVGNTTSADFPLQNSTTSGCPAITPLQGNNGGGQDAFVAKFAAGSGGGCLSYSTYLGGSGSDSATAVAVDSNGDASLTGNTQSSNFPLTLDALQAACATSVSSTGAAVGCDDAFFATFAPTGSPLNYSTLIGGGLHDQGNAIAVDIAGNAYIAGVSESTDFPATPSGFQPCFGGPGVVPPTPCPPPSATSNAFVAEVGAAIAKVAVAPAVLPFGVEPVNGTSASQTVTVSNNSGSSVTFTSITFSADFKSASGTTCSTGSALGNASTCTIAVTFTPTVVGAKTGTLTLTYPDPSNPSATVTLTVILAGTGVSVTASVSPASLSFPNQSPNTSSVPLAVTLSNTGQSPLAITSIATTSGSAFTQTNNCGSSLAAASNCTIEVTFSPTANGTATGTLTITDDAPNSPQTVPLSGTAGSGQLNLSAQTLNFGSQIINTKTTSQSVVVTNTGTSAVSITAVTIAGPNATAFTLSSKTPCSPSIGSGGTCTISINFKPATSGSLSATLSIANNAPGSPETVALAGQGADFGITSSAANATVNPGQSATFTASIAPIGGFDGAVTLTCQGAPTYGSCSVSPEAVTPNGTAAVNATVTVSTLAPASVAPHSGPLLPPASLLKLLVSRRPWLAWLLAALVGIAAGTLGKRRRSWLLVGATLVLALFWMSCSGGGNPNNPANNGTPPGPYQVTITGASNGLSHSVTVTVNVNT